MEIKDESGERKKVSLHRFIMNEPVGMDVDHINGNSLDNRRSNLRACTHAQNMQNMKLSKSNKSGYRGVYWDKQCGKWRSRFSANGKMVEVGTFHDKYEAVLAYERASTDHYGEFKRRVLT